MKKIILLLFFFLVISGSGAVYMFTNEKSIITPVGTEKTKETRLLAYSFENLKKTQFPRTDITAGPLINETDDFISQMFYYFVPEYPGDSDMVKVSGLMNVPKKHGNYPVIVMFRGFVPTEIYKPGIGTQPSASVFARHGYITLAPDFMGFGESASPSADSFENRFQTYTTALSLMSSLPTLNNGLSASYSGDIRVDLSKVGIWGHSNGGHIALAVLEITGVSYPTVLWAPVSKSFPYSILYYTDETDDQGKTMRIVLSNFEKNYDAEKYSLTNYFSWIKAPIEINQGDSDQEVPVWWSDELVDNLKKHDISVKYFTYQGADHNLQPTGWSKAVTESIDFFDENFNKP